MCVAERVLDCLLKHDPNSEVLWWVLILYSLSFYDSSPLEYDVFENLSCALSSERKVEHVM